MAKQETIITAGERAIFPDIRELVAMRGLLMAFVRRGLAVRYRQAAIGICWAVLQPAITVIIFTLVFKRLAALQSDNLPYSLFAAVAMTAWLWFSRSLQEASNSLVSNQQLVTKIWFPRILLPTASLLEAGVEYGVMLALVVLLCAWHGVIPSWHVVFLPAFMVLIAATALGLGFVFSALNVRYRDIRIVVPFLLQAGMFASPVVWSPAGLPETYRWLISVNPLATAFDGMRFCLGGDGSLMTWPAISLSTAVAGLLFVGGAAFFTRLDHSFADEI